MGNSAPCPPPLLPDRRAVWRNHSAVSSATTLNSCSVSPRGLRCSQRPPLLPQPQPSLTGWLTSSPSSKRLFPTQPPKMGGRHCSCCPGKTSGEHSGKSFLSSSLTRSQVFLCCGDGSPLTHMGPSPSSYHLTQRPGSWSSLLHLHVPTSTDLSPFPLPSVKKLSFLPPSPLCLPLHSPAQS